VDGHLPLVTGNLARLQQVFQCLLTNAVQYRRPREPLVIRIGALDLTPNETAISVSDNGEGIAKQYHQVIFEAFKRLHGREIPGTGMGLAISKRIVEAHYGRMWVESEPDHGAKFFFSLPKATDK
jgi:signal transduction histidine kinase